VLVLSEFAGAAVELPEAVMVNPYSGRNMDSNLDRALEMSEPERRQRHGAMAKRVRQWDVDHWAHHVRERFEGIEGAKTSTKRDAA
jgi:glucosylglycerol-phosphate synthase